MHEKEEKLVTNETGRLPLILGCILAAVLIFVLGYSAGKSDGEKTASIEWAAELMKGIYAGDESYIGADNPEALKDVAEVAQTSGKVSSFEVESADNYGGILIIANAERNGALYEEVIHLQGGRLQSFSSMPVAEH